MRTVSAGSTAWLGLSLLIVQLLLPSPAALGAETHGTRLSEADRLWAARADGLSEARTGGTDGRLAVAEATEAALTAYLLQVGDAASVDSTLPARWKALRAAHYLSEFTTAGKERGDRAIAQATRLADESLVALAESTGEDDVADLSDSQLESWLADNGLARHDVAQIHFWSAIVWGAHGQRVGLVTLVRQGIARRMYDHASLAIRIDPSIERGGAFRLLSRLNASLPRVPFVSGWVDRSQALPQAERAYAIDPQDPGNRMILALALRDQESFSRERVEGLLAAVADSQPRPELLAEDLAIREEAAALLTELRAEEPR